MTRWVRFIGPLLLALGGALLAESLVTGGARFYLLVVVPVFTGTSAVFGMAVVLLITGFLTLPMLFASDEGPDASVGAPTVRSPLAGGPHEGSGGVLFIGPVPIFFGSWRRNPPWAYRWAAVLGGVLAVVALLLLWGFSLL